MCCLLPDHIECAPGRYQLQHKPVFGTNFSITPHDDRIAANSQTSADESADSHLTHRSCILAAQRVPRDDRNP